MLNLDNSSFNNIAGEYPQFDWLESDFKHTSSDQVQGEVVEGDEECNTLLMSAIKDHLHPYTEVLLKAGARADLYSQERGRAPIHLAVQVDLKLHQ